MKDKGISDSSLARMAGNIAAGYVTVYNKQIDQSYVAKISVELALLIADEIDKRRPPTPGET